MVVCVGGGLYLNVVEKCYSFFFVFLDFMIGFVGY